MAIGLELELPSADEREWLLDGLARLIEKKGYQKFVEGPVLLPIDEHFPDSVEAGPQGARTLLRRLGTYAGLGALGVRVTVYEQAEHAEFDHRGVGHGGVGAAAWFAGIRNGVCEYGVERRELRDPEDLIGTLGHEVAHAFREHHALAVVTRDVEERLTDLTAVYLGFGVFLLNASHAFKTGGWSESGDRLLFERKVRGYLSPPQIALLLAAQAMARAATPSERGAVSRALAPNHAKLFDDACELFAGEVSALEQRLGVPTAHASWRAASGAVAPPLPPDDLGADGGIVTNVVTNDPTSDVSEAAPRAFRIRRNPSALYAVLGGCAPIIFATTGLVEGSALMGSVAAGALLGYALGRTLRDDRCSACTQRLESRADRCPGCRAKLVGVVASDEERLAAEEALQPAEPEYDYFADSAISDEEKAEARLLTAIFAEWTMTRDLVSASFRDDHAELVERAKRGELATAELCEIWNGHAAMPNDVGQAFSATYFDEERYWNAADYALLTTANRIRDSRACYRRVQALLDRRFEEWKAGHGNSSAATDGMGRLP